MHLSTDGIIVRENIASENDKYIVALTRSNGLISAYARGVRSVKNRNASGCGLLCYSDLTFFKSRDTYKLDEATPKEIFWGLREDIQRLSQAQYFCELCIVLAPEGSEAEEYLRLMLNALAFLAKGEKLPDLIKAVVELRMLTLSGYMPDLVCCAACGEDTDDRMVFSVREGRLFCTKHRPGAGEILLDRTLLAAMRHIVYSDFERLFRFSMSEKAAAALSRVTERFLLEQTERGYKTLDFYHSL